jgi:hypothetical protein
VSRRDKSRRVVAEGEHDASQRKRERGSRRGAGRGGSAGASRGRARDVRGTSEARTAYLGQDILDEPHLGRGVQHAHHEPEDENHEGYPSAPHRGRHRALLGGGARADGRRRRIARYRPRARPALRLPRRHRRALSTPGAPLPSEPSEKPRLGKVHETETTRQSARLPNARTFRVLVRLLGDARRRSRARPRAGRNRTKCRPSSRALSRKRVYLTVSRRYRLRSRRSSRRSSKKLRARVYDFVV